MLTAHADQRVFGYLGRALSLELSAVQQYSSQARLVEAWGLPDAASRFKHEAVEEMGHVDRIIGRMLALGVAPNASQLRPVSMGRSLLELLEHDQALEADLVRLYSDAVAHCHRQGDHDNRMLFQALLQEEQGHGQELGEWILKLKGVGQSSAETRATF